MSTVKTICQPLPALVGALKTPAQKKREKKEDVKASATEKPSTRGGGKTKAIVDTTAKSTPAGLTGKQEQSAAFFKQLAQAPVVATPTTTKEIEAVVDCLIQEQEPEQDLEAEKERLGGVLFGGK
jgi:hypothetical protein